MSYCPTCGQYHEGTTPGCPPQMNQQQARLAQLEADLALAQAVLETAIEHTDEFGAVTVRIEPLAYDEWQAWREAKR